MVERLLGDAFSPIGFTTLQLALPAVMLVTLWKGLCHYMVILAGLQGIPKELYEAADGRRAGESTSTSLFP